MNWKLPGGRAPKRIEVGHTGGLVEGGGLRAGAELEGFLVGDVVLENGVFGLEVRRNIGTLLKGRVELLIMLKESVFIMS